MLLKSHHQFEKDNMFPQTLNHHFRFHDGVLLGIWWSFYQGSLYQRSMVFLEECVRRNFFFKWYNLPERGTISSWDNGTLFQNAILLHMQHSSWHDMEFLWAIRHYFGKYPLQNDDLNWWRRMQNCFISDKIDISLRISWS